MTTIVCVQNLFNLAHRVDDDLIDEHADDGIAFVPFFPLGGFTFARTSSAPRGSCRRRNTRSWTAIGWRR